MDSFLLNLIWIDLLETTCTGVQQAIKYVIGLPSCFADSLNNRYSWVDGMVRTLIYQDFTYQAGDINHYFRTFEKKQHAVHKEGNKVLSILDI